LAGPEKLINKAMHKRYSGIKGESSTRGDPRRVDDFATWRQARRASDDDQCLEEAGDGEPFPQFKASLRPASARGMGHLRHDHRFP